MTRLKHLLRLHGSNPGLRSQTRRQKWSQDVAGGALVLRVERQEDGSTVVPRFNTGRLLGPHRCLVVLREKVLERVGGNK